MVNERFVSTAPIGQMAIDILSSRAPVEISPSTSHESVANLMDGTLGLICRAETYIDGRILDAGKNLKVLGRPGVGYDSVDVVAATERGIPLIYAPVGGFAVAEWAMAAMLALAKRIIECNQMVKLDKWSQRYSLELDDMTEKTLGIVGFGRIGQHLGRLAVPFGMRIVAYDPFVDKKLASAQNVELLDLESLLKTSDYVSLHPALNDSSRGLIKSEHMHVIKKGAILINASRGGVVENLEILADALDEGVLSGVALDVFPEEPPVYPHRIFEHPMCLCAPHMAGLSKLAMLRILKSMANDMLAVVGGNIPKYCVNPEVLNK